MRGQIALAVVITATMLEAQNAVPNDICEKPPAAADMVAVLKPLSKMTVDCLADVIMRYKIRSKFLINVLEGVCHYHAACVPNYLNNRTPQGRKATMECLAQRVSEKMPLQIRGEEFDHSEVIAQIMTCIDEKLDLPVDEPNLISAMLHWLHEASYRKRMS